ncbi:hypothetical protein [Halioxenophilus sp. WMMB6]|uniref:sensor histidine kinase n=1 Tax=Halioxenophilus sp. WMMB6 TaxID=3073815 RepID=UPI00295F3A96|nr:hypothetical protein [Halioxenophilus sp. WMMB6]
MHPQASQPLRPETWSAVDARFSVRFLLYIRLVTLLCAVVALVYWQLAMQASEHGGLLALVIAAALGWTLLVLARPKLQSWANGNSREVLFDLAWSTLVLALAGGAANPFIYYFLVIIAFAAMLLSRRLAWLVCLATIVIYSLLLGLQLQAHFRHFESAYQVHLIGMWLNYLIGAVLICFFVSTLVAALRRQYTLLQQIREQNLNSEQLIGLATVSASAVHNLATPLATLTLLVEELAASGEQSELLIADLPVMQQQIERCQATIKQLSKVARESDQLTPRATQSVIDKLIDHYALAQPERQPRFEDLGGGQGIVAVNELFEFAVINLINNALESTAGEVLVRFGRRAQQLTIAISNRSPAGEQQRLRQWGKLLQSEKTTGLGIGSFLANSTIERLGGTVAIDVEPAAADGLYSVCVTVALPCQNDEVADG